CKGFNMIKHLCREMEKQKGAEFPDLKPDRHVFAFTNGLYFLKKNKFIPYSEIEKSHAEYDKIVAGHYIKLPFPDEDEIKLYESKDPKIDPDKWYDIDTPMF